MRIGKPQGLAIFVLLLVSGLVWGSQRPFSLEKLCGKSEHIVVGKVTKLSYYRAEWPKVGTIPFTDVTIEVEEQWKGKLADAKLVIQVPGGKHADGTRMTVSETPTFQVGEKVLLFTARYNGRQWVYGWEQGKYTMVIQRVVGKEGFPIDEDILTYPLRRQIEELVRKTSKAGKPKKG